MSGPARHPSREAFLAGDGLRALACSTVLIFHAGFGAALQDGYQPRIIGDLGVEFGGAFGRGDALFDVMPLAVSLFFSLSGYLLSRHLIAAYVEGRPLPSLQRFLANRVLRIVPAFWFAVVLSWLIFGIGDSSLPELAAVLLMGQVFLHVPAEGSVAHAWTIDTEWALYLGLPLAAWALTRFTPASTNRGRRLALVGVSMVVVYLVSLAFRAYGPIDTDYQRLFWAAGWMFLPGTALALVETGWAGRWRGAAWGRPLAWGLAGAWLVSALAFVTIDPREPALRAVVASVSTLLLLAAPLVAEWTTRRTLPGLAAPALRWLGERSYSFYLLHFLVGFKLDEWLSGDRGRADLPWLLPLMFAATVGAAAVTYRFVEVPFLRRKAPQVPKAGAPGPEGVAGDERVRA